MYQIIAPQDMSLAKYQCNYTTFNLCNRSHLHYVSVLHVYTYRVCLCRPMCHSFCVFVLWYIEPSPQPCIEVHFPDRGLSGCTGSREWGNSHLRVDSNVPPRFMGYFCCSCPTYRFQNMDILVLSAISRNQVVLVHS